MEEERGKKRGITINWGKLHDDGGRDPLENVIIAGHPPPPPERPVSGDRDGDTQFEGVSDRDLEERITRQKSNLEKLASKMRDNGEKLRVHLKQLEDERERRKAARVQKDTDKWEKPKQAASSRNNGGSIDFREEATAPLAKSMFVSCFERKLEDNSESTKASEFQRESSLYPCNRRNTKSNGELWPRGGQKGRNFPRHCNSSYKRDKRPLSDGGHRGRASSPPFHQVGQDLCSGRNMNDAFQVSGSRHSNDASRVNRFRPRDGPSQANGSKPGKGPTIVVVDEEEPQPMDATEQEEELPDSMSNAKIYYPARSDPKSVEICFADIKCLDPGSYLTSNIMNFYIRYLQQQASPTDRAIRECHFFNTFFYEKLKVAVSYEGKDKDKCFGKFRRWWKGVNLFEKAYVLIPINEDVHWSLVIICIPDKEEEAGPIVLHLDSLGIHSPRSVFQNIKSYLKEEWSYLDREVDLSISGGTWEQLPEKIEEKKLSLHTKWHEIIMLAPNNRVLSFVTENTVPQQKNEYDCGLFVLFFMERFIEEAPPRLRKKDLTAMFGRRWFKPEEASSLRKKIRKLLIQEFRDAQQANPSEDSAPSVVSSKDSPFEFTDV